MLTLLIFLVVLSVLVFVHEFGHFITAKRAKLRVEEFGFGFPPRIWGLKRGDTIYSINALPFGGFVRIKGESGEDERDHDSFASRPAWQRLLIIVAGVAMNVVLTVVLLTGGYTIGFPQILEGEISKYAEVRDQHIEVLSVLPSSPAEKAGLKPGDWILGGDEHLYVPGKTEEFRAWITEKVRVPVKIPVEHDGERRNLTITPEILEKTGKAGIGVAIADVGMVRYPVWLAFPKAVEMTGVLAKTIVASFGILIRDWFAGQPVSAELAGPVGIAVLTGQAARQGLVFLLQFVAILSLNLAILNILPIPALDGGRALFILLEKFLRRKVARHVEHLIHQVGFVLLILLVLFVTYRDLGKYGGKILQFFGIKV